MSRLPTEQAAKRLAAERGESYGMSVIDGYWYVGTDQQLAAVACIPAKPQPAMKSAIRLWLDPQYRGWIATWDGPEGDKVLKLFGTRHLPTGFTSLAKQEDVLAEITRLNPDVDVSLSSQPVGVSR